jgi:hypothetical protein
VENNIFEIEINIMILLPYKGMPISKVKPRRFLSARVSRLKKDQANMPLFTKSRKRRPAPVIQYDVSPSRTIAILLIAILFFSVWLVKWLFFTL